MHLVDTILKRLNESPHCFSAIDIGTQNYGDLDVEKYADRFSSPRGNKSSGY